MPAEQLGTLLFCTFLSALIGFILGGWFFDRIGKTELKRKIGKPAKLRDIFKPGEEITITRIVPYNVTLLAFVISPIINGGLIIIDLSPRMLKISAGSFESGKYRYEVEEVRDKSTGKIRTEEKLVPTGITRVDIAAKHKPLIIRRNGCEGFLLQ